jgi:TIR domain
MIFLSYGRLDAQDLAEQLHGDLTARGFRIWQDRQRISTGWNWDEEIQAGLQASRALLALMSPHSVRRAGAMGNADSKDSVCLDEIAFARGTCRIPIVPVRAARCQTPLLIYRLQAVDMTRWNESAAQ